jgi:hypothetical protein
MPIVFTARPAAATALVALLASALPHSDAAAQTGFVAGSRELFAIDFAAETLGEVPRRIRMVMGNVEMVMKDGMPMLKASERAAFVISFAEALPDDFTLEFDLTPKSCCQPEDLAFEGTPAINQSEFSMNFMWSRDALRAVGGGASMDVPMPPEIAVMLPAQLTEVRARIQGESFQVWTNGTQVVSWSGRKFPRGRVLRVFLGGQDEHERAVYLSRLRIATNAPAPAGTR